MEWVWPVFKFQNISDLFVGDHGDRGTMECQEVGVQIFMEYEYSMNLLAASLLL